MNTLSKGKSTALFLFIGGLLLVALDQLTKYVALKFAYLMPVYGFKNFLGFVFVLNRGAAWGIFAAHTWLLGLLSALATVVLPIWIMKQKTVLEKAIWMCIWAGAFGNGIDRVFRGSVVDFLYLWPWPVFNIADLCISFGACAWLLFSFFNKEK